MRKALWPECSDEMHAVEMNEYLAKPETKTVLFFLDTKNKPRGFAELSIRSRVDGSLSSHVGYLEGWYVDTQYRGQGIGRKLVESAEKWVKEKGFSELASDAELENVTSVAAHKALGFRENLRLVHFIKKI